MVPSHPGPLTLRSMNAADGGEAAEPARFVAVTMQVYRTSLVSPVTMIGLVVPVAVPVVADGPPGTGVHVTLNDTPEVPPSVNDTETDDEVTRAVPVIDGGFGAS